MSKKMFMVYVLLGVFLTASLVHAQDREHEGHKRSGKKGEEIYSQLNLSNEQKKALEKNKSQNGETRKAFFKQLHSYKEALNGELMKPELNMDKINEIQSQLKAFQAQMADNRLNAILEVRKILTPEQFVKFISLMEKHEWEGPRGR